MSLTKYVFPVVRSVIDRLGAPRELQKVAPCQRGPLLVTLAMDISSDCTRDICSHFETASVEECLPKDSLIPDLFEGLPVRSDGAGQILLMTNARWWTEFAKRSEAKFRALSKSTGPLRILLRSAAANAAATKMTLGKINYDAAWLDIAKNPQDFFSVALPRTIGVSSLKETTIRKWRSLLMKEDAKGRRWIYSKAGCFHPSTSSYWEDRMDRNTEFTMWRARNELYYCLSQGKEELMVPIFSKGFSKENWQDWLEKARLESPPYWCPKKSARPCLADH